MPKSRAVQVLLGLFCGVVLGSTVAGVVVGAAAFAVTKKADHDARSQWVLVPVAVAGEDLKPGGQLSLQQVSRRAVPEQLVTESVIKPDDVSYVVEQPIEVPFFAGDALRWAYFSAPRPPEGMAPMKWAALRSECGAGYTTWKGARPADRSIADIERHLPGARSMKWFVLSLVTGLLCSALGAWWLVIDRTEPQLRAVRVGWGPISVLALTRDVAEGDVLADDDLTETSLPAQFVTDSFVLPNVRSLVVGRRVTSPLSNHDALMWQAFATRPDAAVIRECAVALERPVDEATAKATLEGVARFEERRWKGPTGTVDRPTALTIDADGRARVVSAKVDISEESILTADMLTVRSVPSSMVTASLVPEADMAKLIGARMMFTLLAHDPILWQQLDDATAPRSEASCLRLVSEAKDAALPAVIHQAVSDFYSAKEPR